MVATRFVVADAGPATLAFFRYAIGFLCLVPFLLARGEAFRFARRDVAPIALLGILQFGVLIALLNFGLKSVPSGRAALLFATFPLMTMLLAAALGHERLTLAKSTGVVLTIVGVGLALGEKALARGGDDAWVGEAAVLASAFCGALCAVLFRPYVRRYPTLPVSAAAMLASVAFLALLASGEGLFSALPRLGAGGWGAVLFIGVSSGVFYFVWLWALAHAPATEVTVFLALSPVTAALLGTVLLGEPLTPLMAGGLVAVAVGLALAHRQRRPRSLSVRADPA